MLISRGLRPRPGAPLALTIGNFDGVHRGHQRMLARVQEAARQRGLTAAVLTFEPHPRELFAPAAAPTRLTSLREKLELLSEHGVQRAHVQHFTRDFAALAPDDFASGLLCGALDVRWALVGEDFRYGARRAGDLQSLRAAGAKYDFEVETMPTVLHDGVRVSSSAVREALAAGNLARAEALLGRSYSISGRVVRGKKLGRELGFPTANVQMKHNRPPLSGIFAVRVYGADDKPRNGAASLGVRPTVAADGQMLLEVHLFDFDREIYGRHLRVEFLAKLRNEEKYDDLEALKAQIGRDCVQARRILESH